LGDQWGSHTAAWKSAIKFVLAFGLLFGNRQCPLRIRAEHLCIQWTGQYPKFMEKSRNPAPRAKAIAIQPAESNFEILEKFRGNFTLVPLIPPDCV
jgi:hypothetical protein